MNKLNDGRKETMITMQGSSSEGKTSTRITAEKCSTTSSSFYPRAILLTAMLACGLIFVGLSSAQAQLSEPTAEDQNVAKQIAKMLSKNHLSGHAVDDFMSQRFYNNYLEALDPQRLYFLATDIQKFEKQKLLQDDYVLDGNLKFALEVYQLFIQRVSERAAYAKVLLGQEHDFTIDEALTVDRDDAPYAADVAALNDLWRKRIKYLLLDKIAGGEDPAEAVIQLEKRYRNFELRVKQADNHDLLQTYLTALTHAYDPHSTYMSAATLENFQISMRLELEGIGASLTSEDGYTIITNVIRGGAAAKDGRLEADDKIVGVAQDKDGEWLDVVDMKLGDVVKHIRGKKGTLVRLKIMRKGVKDRFVIDLIRAKVKLEDGEAHGEIIETSKKDNGEAYKVGVIDLPSFYSDMAAIRRGEKNYKSTTRDVQRLVLEFKKNKIDALVIDLRRNGGGSLSEAIEMTGLFVDAGAVVQVKDSAGVVSQYNDRIPGKLWNGPLVVLISKFSASASEIFAGAVQDHGRGLIIGDNSTHGKGTVQELQDVGRYLSWRNTKKLGALKITKQQFYRPNGDSTQNRGVVSDITLPSLANNSDLGEARLDYAVPFDQVPRGTYVRENGIDDSLIQDLRDRSSKRRQGSEEFDKLQEDIARYLKYKNRKTVPLKKDKFMAEYNEINQDSEEKKPEDSVANTEKEEEKWHVEQDFYFNEIMAILVDFMRIKEKVASVE